MRYEEAEKQEEKEMETEVANGCPSCEATLINGVFCHETGCPDSWRGGDRRGRARECPWCGQSFRPDERCQRFCCQECAESYNN